MVRLVEDHIKGGLITMKKNKNVLKRNDAKSSANSIIQGTDAKLLLGVGLGGKSGSKDTKLV